MEAVLYKFEIMITVSDLVTQGRSFPSSVDGGKCLRHEKCSLCM